MKDFRLLSIDPGFKRFGYCIFNEDADVVDHGVYSTRERGKDEKYQEYLNNGIFSMYHWFGELLEDKKITNIISEIVPPISGKGNFGVSPQVPLVLSVMAVCKVMAYEDELDWIDISARSVKSILTGDSSVSKPNIRRLVVETYPEIRGERKLTDIPFDETDAVAVGMSYFPDFHFKKNS
jgi:Holliday junction resolvasome RuvABC endonuclease subunit